MNKREYKRITSEIAQERTRMKHEYNKWIISFENCVRVVAKGLMDADTKGVFDYDQFMADCGMRD